MSIKVLHLRSSSGFYGAERVILTLMKRGVENDLETKLACIENYLTGDQSLLKNAEQSGMDVFEIPCRRRLDFTTIRSLIHYCRENEINIIHSHDYKSHFYGIMATRFVNCRHVATQHGKTSGDVKNRVYELIENTLLKMVDHVTVVSQSLYDDLSCRVGENVSLIANGVDEASFNPTIKGFGKEHWGFGQSTFVFGTVARMSEEKGHRILIEAFTKTHLQHGNTGLLLVGTGPLFSELKEFTREKGMEDCVKFVGTQNEIDRVLNDLDCYVSPSLTEGMPMSILEAMASALPIVATDVGAVGYLLRGGVGRLAHPDNVDSLAKEMNYIIENKNQLQVMGGKARKKAEDEFSAGKQSREFSRIYRQLHAYNL